MPLGAAEAANIVDSIRSESNKVSGENSILPDETSRPETVDSLLHLLSEGKEAKLALEHGRIAVVGAAGTGRRHVVEFAGFLQQNFQFKREVSARLRLQSPLILYRRAGMRN